MDLVQKQLLAEPPDEFRLPCIIIQKIPFSVSKKNILHNIVFMWKKEKRLYLIYFFSEIIPSLPTILPKIQKRSEKIVF